MQTVLNLDNNKAPQPMFFGKELGIQRYDVVKYPIFTQLWKMQRNYFWTPEEFGLQKDRSDYQNMLDYEKHIYTSNLKYQILLDSVQGRAVNLAFLPVVSLPELEQAIIAWGFFEVLHSESYTHIIKNVYPHPNEIFDHVLDDVEIIKRAKSVTRYYDNFCDLLTVDYHQMGETRKNEFIKLLKESLYLAVVNVNILEGIRFYTSFACSFAFAESRKMMDSANIISLIARDEACFTPGHELLTSTGWKLIENINENDKIAQYNTNGTIEFVEPINVIHKHYTGKVYNFFDSASNIQQIVTADHRMISRNVETGKIEETVAENFYNNRRKLTIVSGVHINGHHVLSDIQKFYLLYYFCGKQVHTNPNEGYALVDLVINNIAVDQLKLIQVFSNLNIFYKNNKNTRYKTDLYTHYICKVPLEVMDNSKMSMFRYDLASHQYVHRLVEFIAIIQHKSNIKRNKTAITIRITHEKMVDWLIGFLVIGGFYFKKNRNPNGDFSLGIRPGKDSIKSDKPTRIEIDYNNDVHCVTVPSGMILVKYQDSVVVSGNCHQRITENIIKNWQNGDDPDILEIMKKNEDTVYDMYKVAVDEEIYWTYYLFKHGSILGLNVELLTEYIKYLCDRRLRAINKQELYGVKKNPLPWVDNYLKSKGVVVAPQETEIRSYINGGIKNDFNLDSLSKFKL